MLNFSLIDQSTTMWYKEYKLLRKLQTLGLGSEPHFSVIAYANVVLSRI